MNDSERIPTLILKKISVDAGIFSQSFAAILSFISCFRTLDPYFMGPMGFIYITALAHCVKIMEVLLCIHIHTYVHITYVKIHYRVKM